MNTAAPDPSAERGFCPWCEGQGILSTGITESPTTICNSCDGTGYADSAPTYPDATGWAGPGHARLGDPSPCCPAGDGRTPTLYAMVHFKEYRPLHCSHCNKGSYGLHYPKAVKP